MSTIYYFSGPHEPAIPPAADAGGLVAGHNDNKVQAPASAASVLPDYAYLADRPVDDFNGDRPVTRCDRCTIVLGAVVIVCAVALVWSFEYIRMAQLAVHS
jgi:hypothetical protein